MQERTSQAAQLQEFDDFVQEMMRDWKVQGLAVAVVRDGETLFARGFGKRNVSENLAVTPRTLFPIASCTKAFTAAALGLLVDEGKLDWNTPVRHYLPDFKLYDPIATERMTPRDLVTHRSGLPRHDLVWYHSPASRAEIFTRLQYLEPTTDFRLFWQYQNLMYMVAGYLLERITGQSWEAFVQERLFARLGMTASNFSAQEAERRGAEVAHPYHEIKDEVKELPFYEEWGIGPAGSIVSNVEDMSRWMLMHLSGGVSNGERILSPSQIAQLHAPQMIVPETSKHPEMPYSSYAHGWIVTPYKGHPMIRHGGNIDGFSSLTSLFPRENVGIVVLTNMGGSYAPYILTYNLFERLLGLEQTPWSARFKEEQAEMKEAERRSEAKGAEERVPETHPSHALEDYTGEYEHPGYGVVTVSLLDGQLQAHYHSMSASLQHYHYDIFDLFVEHLQMHMKISFSTNVRGDIESLSVPLETSGRDIIFRRAPASEIREKSFLEQFVGIYQVMNTDMIVALKGEHALLLSVFGQPEHELEPYKGDEFHIRDMSNFRLEFQRDASGAVTQALLTTPEGTFLARR